MAFLVGLRFIGGSQAHFGLTNQNRTWFVVDRDQGWFCRARAMLGGGWFQPSPNRDDKKQRNRGQDKKKEKY